MSTVHSVKDGIRVYTNWGLKAYDFVIYKLFVNYVWRCDTEIFLDFYQCNLSRNHADVGVGTSFCLAHCDIDACDMRLALFDLNPNCLKYSAQRLAHLSPEVYQQDATEAFSPACKPFDSIGLGGILHCLPGDMACKAKVFDQLKTISNPGTRIFGYTIINQGVRKTALSRLIAGGLNFFKIINNHCDSASALEHELAKRFKHYQVDTVAHIAFFTAYE